MSRYLVFTSLYIFAKEINVILSLVFEIVIAYNKIKNQTTIDLLLVCYNAPKLSVKEMLSFTILASTLKHNPRLERLEIKHVMSE